MPEILTKVLLVTQSKRSRFNVSQFSYSKTINLMIQNKDSIDTRQLRGIGWDMVILNGVTMQELKTSNQDAYEAIVNGCSTNKVVPIEL